MIAKIKGKIAFLRDHYAVVDVAGVGYKIFVTDFAMGKIAGKEEIELFTHTYVREDTLSLYGFLTLDELGDVRASDFHFGNRAQSGDRNLDDCRAEDHPNGDHHRRFFDSHTGFGRRQKNSRTGYSRTHKSRSRNCPAKTRERRAPIRKQLKHLFRLAIPPRKHAKL